MRSIELGWLQRKAKDVPYPELLFLDKKWHSSGSYFRPVKQEGYIYGKFYDLSKGLIVIATENRDISEIPETLAHEWRHHWQTFNMKYDRPVPFDSKLPYDDAIKKFFKSIKELDALLFAHKISPSWVTDYWMGLLKNENIIIRRPAHR